MPTACLALTVDNAAAWSYWLAQEASTSRGVWLTLAKKGTTVPTSLTIQQALEEALCHGWINGQARKRDVWTHSQRFTARTARSTWSKRNVDIVARLEREGRMQAGGRAALDAAKADGRLDAAYDGQSDAEMPPEFLAALAKVPKSQSTWYALNKRQHYAIYFRLHALKTAAARQKRVAAFVDMLARGETSYPQRRAVTAAASTR